MAITAQIVPAVEVLDEKWRKFVGGPPCVQNWMFDQQKKSNFLLDHPPLLTTTSTKNIVGKPSVQNCVTFVFGSVGGNLGFLRAQTR